MKSSITTHRLCLVLLSCLAVSQVESQVGADFRDETDQYFRSREYSTAIDGYRKILKDDPNDSRSWFRLGYSLHVEGDYEQATVAYKRAISQNYAVMLSRYNLACAYAMSGKRELALAALEDAIASGYSNSRLMRQDADLRSLSSSPEFEALMARADDPARYYEAGRRLDDLQGLWQATSNEGQVASLTANTTSNGYCREVELLMNGSRQLSLNFIFVASRARWEVVGASNLGEVFSGPVETPVGSIVCHGKQQIDGRWVPTKARLSFNAGATAKLAFEVQSNGTWQTSRSFDLRPR